ncbi:MAG: hypothetical protein F6J95_021630 [Leptolyngbya sp. SIO1E4]|nr:hypothetical protein [Leptolyngbya sp. SIO1E4]
MAIDFCRQIESRSGHQPVGLHNTKIFKILPCDRLGLTILMGLYQALAIGGNSAWLDSVGRSNHDES